MSVRGRIGVLSAVILGTCIGVFLGPSYEVRADRACARAAQWLSQVRSDPELMREYGLKGKKKLVELEESYEAILPFLSSSLAAQARQRLAQLREYAGREEYHRMLTLDDAQFDEDSTSYLRMWYLLDLQGFALDSYRTHIREILPRLRQRLPMRGVNQRMAFKNYLVRMGIDEPLLKVIPFSAGIIRQRLDPQVLSEKEIYDLTHEVFAAHEAGDMPYLTAEDRQYLARALPFLLNASVARHNVDLAAELILCGCYLGISDSFAMQRGLGFLLSSQNRDGSFGKYDDLRPVYGDFVREGFYLHTTEVALKAITCVRKPGVCRRKI